MLNTKTIMHEVEEILVKNPEARDSDERLYGVYLTGRIGLESAISFFLNFPTAKYRDIASFQTISRLRRKVQEKHPELRASKIVEDGRDGRQGSFFDMARGFDVDVAK